MEFVASGASFRFPIEALYYSKQRLDIERGGKRKPYRFFHDAKLHVFVIWALIEARPRKTSEKPMGRTKGRCSRNELLGGI